MVCRPTAVHLLMALHSAAGSPEHALAAVEVFRSGWGLPAAR